jgi:formylglycine-generating enzyme required for sulfatase activity
MKKLLVVLFFLTAVFAFGQQKYALVIGNGNYISPDWKILPNPTNDAADMKAALESLGFQVDLVSNGNLDQMEKAVINFNRKLSTSRSAYGFFFYAGHGVQHQGENYLIPVDANIPSKNVLPQRSMSVGYVLKELEDAKNELNIIVLDACREFLPDNWERDRNSATRGLAPVQIPRGSIVSFATAPNSVAADGDGRNGLYTGFLLNNLTTPGLDVNEVFRRTGSDVERATRGRQYPETRYMYHEIAYLGSRPTPGSQPTPTPATTVQPASVPDNMVRINGGTFTMGSPANEPERNSGGDIEVQHQVTVSSFYMGKYEVTQKEYQEVMGTNPSKFKGNNLPVEQVSWYDAVEYCNKRSQREGLTPAYIIDKNRSDPNNKWHDATVRWLVTRNADANGYRLPTEAEWEYACRAGTTTPFSTGNNVTTNQANFNGYYPYNNNAKGTSREKTTTVGSFTPNAWGLYDMHGNVWEWCWDWSGDYSSNAQTDPVGAISADQRVIRGGSWYNYGRHLRSANRGVELPENREDRTGFRLVRP